MRVKIVGAGLAGCEAAWQLAKRQITVDLYEMKPLKRTAAHNSDFFAELVCSNSLRSDVITNAVGLLKEEMRLLDSIILQCADLHQVPAGSALAVDRELFAQEVDTRIRNNPYINVITDEVTSVFDGPCIIATGPLTSDRFSEAIGVLLGVENFYFYDAAAPIVTKASIDFNKAYYKSRYDKGDADYINCPMTKEEFFTFYNELINAKTSATKEFEKEIFFEGCMPIEVMAKRGEKTLTFGPLKPVGLANDVVKPYAVVQLRQDNAIDTLYNLVGFQTHLLWPEQKRVFRLIPGLENAEFVRLGVMHRNNYICSPLVLKPTYQTKKRSDLFFAGQITGVEGYVESAASGLFAGINMAQLLLKNEVISLPNTCMIGAMANYITTASSTNFQPMNANFGIMSLLEKTPKALRKEALANQALDIIKKFKDEVE